jgi:hypothetical protein
MAASVPVAIASNQSAISVDGSAVTQPVSASSLPLPSGAATESTLAAAETHLGAIEVETTSIDAKLPGQGQALMAASVPVAIASNQSAIAVDGSAVTQPVSASSLPLPTGAATESTLSSLNGKVIACDTGSIAGSVTANAGTNLNTSALALETGGNLATIAGDTTSLDTKITSGSDASLTDAQQVLIYGRNGTGALKPIHITNNGDVEVEIADMVKGNTTASASFPVTDASKKVKDVSWMTSETISNQTRSTSTLDTEGYAHLVIYGEMTTPGSGNDIKIHGSNTSGGTYYHCGQLSINTTETGRYMLLEDLPHANGGNAPRYLKVFNGTGGSISGVTLRATMSNFHEYQ